MRAETEKKKFYFFLGFSDGLQEQLTINNGLFNGFREM